MNVNRFNLPRVLFFVALLLVVFLLTGCPPPRTRVGQRPLVITPEEPQQTKQRTLHIIQRGDTLYSLAGKYGCEWQKILSANPTIKPENLEPGQVIIIPVAKPKPVAPQEPRIDQPSVSKETPTPKEPKPLSRRPGHAGPLPAEKNFVWPLRGPILARFGRAVPWRKNARNHGIDIKAGRGQAVVAAKSGKVYTCEDVGIFGRVMVLEHRDGTVTLYGHLQDILIEHGTWAKQGERIATAGSSGWASGTELHFQIMRNSSYVDPLRLLPK